MNNNMFRFGNLLTGVAAVALLLATVGNALGVTFGVGSSESKDALAAGTEAAQAAAEALGDKEAKLVLVFHRDDLAKDSKKVLDGVSSVFDAGIVYGANAYAALTHENNDGMIAVLALADVDVAAAVAPVDGDHQGCGQSIGKRLKSASEAATDGKLLLLFGACHIPSNDDLVKGVLSVLGEDLAVIGGAAYEDRTYAAGKPVEESNVGLLISGDFKCGFGINKDNSPKGLIASAKETFEQAVGDAGDKVALMLVFDCGGRRGKMLENGNFSEELSAMKSVVGDTPIFGFYGSGEIGRKCCNSPSFGDGFHISATALIPK
jgi:hypothetical protein